MTSSVLSPLQSFRSLPEIVSIQTLVRSRIPSPHVVEQDVHVDQSSHSRTTLDILLNIICEVVDYYWYSNRMSIQAKLTYVMKIGVGWDILYHELFIGFVCYINTMAFPKRCPNCPLFSFLKEHRMKEETV